MLSGQTLSVRRPDETPVSAQQEVHTLSTPGTQGFALERQPVHKKTADDGAEGRGEKGQGNSQPTCHFSAPEVNSLLNSTPSSLSKNAFNSRESDALASS
ncbi:hypothetical protein F3W83_17110 [Micrococcus luteus]|nr:hypothetical protein [Micrococcus luteus]